MDRTDGRLAPVTYLPGVPRPSGDPSVPDPAVSGPTGFDPAVSEPTVSDPSAPAEPEWAVPFGDDVEAARGAGTTHDETAVDDALARARAERVSLHALTRRGLSQREVERTLRDRGLDDDVVAAEVERLQSVGLVDDLALAQELVARLQERKGLGRTAIAAELARRMLHPSAISYALDLVDGGDELARARDLASKRAGQLRGLDRETAVRRLSGYLQRRGYSGSTVRAAVEQALASSAASRVTFR
ncbi:MAG: RecX family transcriptional regulator [Actinomycetales bacterium]|nr:RecX family transcriptional regulator [Actinomycetales bacterium]